MLIPVLACNDTKSTSRWDSLRTQFFENNKELILHQLGYTNLVEAFEKIPLDESDRTVSRNERSRFTRRYFLREIGRRPAHHF